MNRLWRLAVIGGLVFSAITRCSGFPLDADAGIRTRADVKRVLKSVDSNKDKPLFIALSEAASAIEVFIDYEASPEISMDEKDALIRSAFSGLSYRQIIVHGYLLIIARARMDMAMHAAGMTLPSHDVVVTWPLYADGHVKLCATSKNARKSGVRGDELIVQRAIRILSEFSAPGHS